MSFTYNITDPITTLSENLITVRYTATKTILGKVKVRLVQASTLGTIDYPGTQSASSDFIDLKDTGDIKISLDFENFVNFTNDMVLQENGMPLAGSGTFYLKFIQSNNWVEGRRLYIGVEVFEAS
jgi:hypothetical protein